MYGLTEEQTVIYKLGGLEQQVGSIKESVDEVKALLKSFTTKQDNHESRIASLESTRKIMFFAAGVGGAVIAKLFDYGIRLFT